MLLILRAAWIRPCPWQGGGSGGGGRSVSTEKQQIESDKRVNYLYLVLLLEC